MRQSVRILARTVRAGDWWDHKLVLALAIFYGTALHAGVSVASIAPAAVALLVAIAAAAIFVSVINDLADRDDDRVAGKVNRLTGASRGRAAALAAVPMATGAFFLWTWHADPTLALAYAGSWIAFSLYSLPPFRLKRRGLAGALADATGAHLFPALVAILLASSATGKAPDLWWIAPVALWSLAYGIRGIVWHQLSDVENDRRAGVSTFVRRLSREAAAKQVRLLFFPLEAIALAAMLVRLGSPVPYVFLGLYLLLLWLRVRFLGTRAVIVAAQGDWTMVLQEYYELFLPVSILAASALIHPLDWLVLAIHLILFHRRARAAGRWARALMRPKRQFPPATG